MMQPIGSSNSICAADSLRTVLRTICFGLRLGPLGRGAASHFPLLDASDEVANQVAQQRLLLNKVLTLAYFDRLVPRLS
ncbi:MAG: hypothetical protein HYY98_09505 [Burkholderiales bacterium]|nr:hypothetical protein [Burkholderiales bacterium]